MSRKSPSGTPPDGDESVRNREAADPAIVESAAQVDALLTQPPAESPSLVNRERAMALFEEKAWEQLGEASKWSPDPTMKACAWEILDFMAKKGAAESNFSRAINGQPYEGGKTALGPAHGRLIETPEQAIDYAADRVGGQARAYLEELKRIIANRRSMVRRERDSKNEQPSA